MEEMFVRPIAADDPTALLRNAGSWLLARPDDSFEVVPLVELATQFAKDGKLDFFGGTGARHFF